MTLNEILESIGNRTVTWAWLTNKLTTNGWESEPTIKHFLKSELLNKVDKGLYKVGERFNQKPKPIYKPEAEIMRTVNAMSLEAAIELCRSHGIDCSRVTSVQHGNVRVVTRVIL
jgi:hypothetical protein